MNEVVKSTTAGVALLGSSITIKGEVRGSEDLRVEGEIEGRIELISHNLTIGSQGRVQAQVHANNVVVEGTVNGDILAQEKITIQQTAVVSGDLRAPRIVIADGAQFRGSIDMSKPDQARPAAKLQAQPSPPHPPLAGAAERS